MKDEIQFLRDRVEQLEEALGLNVSLPNELGLTPLEDQIVATLVKRDIMSRDALFLALYSNRPPNSQPDPKTIDVHICKVRRKLQAKGIRIYTRYGAGYYLDSEAKAALKSMIPSDHQSAAA